MAPLNINVFLLILFIAQFEPIRGWRPNSAGTGTGGGWGRLLSLRPTGTAGTATATAVERSIGTTGIGGNCLSSLNDESPPIESHKWGAAAIRKFAAAALTAALLQPGEAPAAIAPLADVGVKEFLVKDGNQFLRLGLPYRSTSDALLLGASSVNAVDRIAQESLELIKLRFEQVGVSNPSVWGGVSVDATTAQNTILKNRDFFTKSANDPAAAAVVYDSRVVPALSELTDSVKKRDADRCLIAQDTAARALADLRLMSLPQGKLPYSIPDEYNGLPRLNGRATVKITIKSKQGFRLEDSKTILPTADFELIVDGYHAPLTSGNFVDLVDKKFYDGLPMQKVEELTVQTGLPKDPSKVAARNPVPLELFYKSDKEPVYGITSDDDMRATETTALPFQAFGALGMARENDQPDSANTQFFFLKWKQALIAPGRNTLDGFYSCFGYVTSSNAYLLGQLTPEDVITSAKVIEGISNLQR